MLTPKPKSAYLHVRVTPQVRSKFHAKAIKYSNPEGTVTVGIRRFVLQWNGSAWATPAIMHPGQIIRFPPMDMLVQPPE